METILGKDVDDQHRDIATAFLALSHGGFITASIGATAISVTLAGLRSGIGQVNNTFSKRLKQLSIGWAAGSTGITVWTQFAIIRTWQSSATYKHQIFGNLGFSILTLVNVFIGLLNLWTAIAQLQS